MSDDRFASLRLRPVDRRGVMVAGTMAGGLLSGGRGWAAVHGDAPHLDPAQDDGDGAPHCYWPWMNGNISLAGITLDLEAMRRMGICGAYILDVALGIPRGPVDYGSHEWTACIRHAAAEARRCGIALFMHNAAGYSGTGGPWIAPGESQQQLVWRETRIEGGGMVEAVLAWPYAKLGFYRDHAVLAYPQPEGTGAPFHSLVRRVLADGRSIDPAVLRGPDPSQRTRIEPHDGQPAELLIELAQPIRAQAITVYRTPEDPRDPFDGPRDYPPRFTLEASHDGAVYRPICDIAMPPLRALEAPGVASFAPVEARFFRLRASSPSWISGVEIHDEPRLADWAVKANGAPGAIPPPQAAPTPSAIDPRAVVDLSGHVDQDGRLRWQAPPGRWIVLRIGHTATGQTLAAAADSGVGLNIDMFDPAAVDRHFDRFLDPLCDALGDLVGTGLTALHIDSFEEGRQNWSPAFPAAFRARAGYPLGAWLLAMTGRIVGDVGRTEQALFDVRKVQAAMMATGYTGRMRERAHRRGLALHLEPYGDGAFDSLTSAAEADFALSEFWAHYTYGADSYSELAVSAAHARGTRLVAAEAFTGEPRTSRWMESPYGLTAEAHRMMAIGVNRFVLHTFVHQPHPTAAPGMTMGPFGTHFDRNCGWAEEMPAWTRYIAHCHHLLRQGDPVVDVACFVGEEVANALPSCRDAPYAVPLGYAADMLGRSALLALRGQNGRAQAPKGPAYRLIVVPPLDAASPELLDALATLAQAGVPVLMQAWPTRAPGGPEDRAATARVAAACARLRAARGTVTQATCAQALVRLGIMPDFSFTAERPDAALFFLHRRVATQDVYFVCNDRRRPERATVQLRAPGQAYIWDPLTREKRLAARTADGRLTLDLPPSGAVFILFASDAREIRRMERDGQALSPPASYPVPAPAPHADCVDDFVISAWIKPETVALPGRGHIAYPADGARHYGPGHAVAALSAGIDGLFVTEVAESAHTVLEWRGPVSGWTHVALAYGGGAPDLLVNGAKVASARPSGRRVHPGLDAPEVLRHALTRFEGDIAGLRLDRGLLDLPRLQRDVAAGLPAPQDTPAAQVILDAAGNRALCTRQDGTYRITIGGLTSQVTVSGIVSQPHEEPWELRLPAGSMPGFPMRLARLAPLEKHKDPRVRHFAGRLCYATNAHLRRPAAHQRLLLTLGRLDMIATVRINGAPAGVTWRPPHEIDISDHVIHGLNRIEVIVTIGWPNRLIGESAQSSQGYAPAGNILALPAWYSTGEPPPPGADACFSTWNHYSADTPLFAAGLLGPVHFRLSAKMSLD